MSELKYENLNNNNSFDNKDDDLLNKKIVNIRKNNRNRRKCVTIIEGLDEDLYLKKISKHLSKLFHCSSTIINDSEFGDIIQLQGDVRNDVRDWLLFQEIIKDKSQINIHGD